MASLAFDGVGLTVQAGLDHGAAVFSPTWTDISADVRAVSIVGAGVLQDFSDASIGTSEILLANDGDALRRYDPSYAAGPYFGRLLPRRQIRVTATYASITYDLSRGPLLGGWPQRYRSPSAGTVTAQTADMTGLLAQTPIVGNLGAAAPYTAAAHVVIGQILDQVSWPAGLRLISADSSSTVNVGSLSGSLLSALHQVCQTEQGRLYVDGAGRVVFRSVTWLLTNSVATTSGATFGDGSTDLDLGAEFDIEDGARGLYNVVTCGASSASDATSRTAYLDSGLSVGGAWGTTESSASYAAWILSRTKQPVSRPSRLVVRPRMDPTNLFPKVLAYGPGQRITVTRRPSNTTAITIPCLIERVSHQVTTNDWVTTWDIGPVLNPGGETFATYDDVTYDDVRYTP